MKAVIIYFLMIIFSVPASESDIVGIWKIPEENIEVEIKKNGDSYNGVIVKAEKAAAIGKEILRDLKEKDGKYTGKIYAIRKDRLLDVVITPNGDELNLEIDAGWRTKTIKWTRVE
jgi:uncharacterized protein (DUF2147 family)